MYSQLRTKYLLLVISFLFFKLGIAQSDTVRYVKSPYSAEYTPHFQFGQFKRGFYNDSLKIALDNLESKPRAAWSRMDSLSFAEISLRTGNKDLAHYYFENLQVNYQTERSYWFDHLLINYLESDFEQGLNDIKKSSPMILEYSEIYFFKKIFEAKKLSLENDKWHKNNEVLNWEVDTSLNRLDKESEEFQLAVIHPLLNLEKALKKIIAFVHEEDPVIANTCREMGHIIEAHLSLSQAYIAYSLGRHYNKWDKPLLADLKAVKAKMTEKKYKIPNFRKYFPRIE